MWTGRRRREDKMQEEKYPVREHLQICNPVVTDRKAKIAPPKDHPSIYVGESAGSAKERTEEHWRGFREKREDSHILKHHILHHQGEGELSFHMKVAGVFRVP